jgi:predicted RNA-binding protein with PUA-like domain
MTYWLAKTEPNVFSWDDLEKKPANWDGVRNYAARNHLRAMQKGDLVFIYHSNIGKEIVGIAKVTKEHFPDPTAKEGDWSAVEVKADKKFKKTLPLADIKIHKVLKNMTMIKIGRLSVTPVTEVEAKLILDLTK